VNAIHRTSGAILAALLRFRNFRIHAKRDGISRPSRSKLKRLFSREYAKKISNEIERSARRYILKTGKAYFD
jgi:hypothetical protein